MQWSSLSDVAPWLAAIVGAATFWLTWQERKARLHKQDEEASKLWSLEMTSRQEGLCVMWLTLKDAKTHQYYLRRMAIKSLAGFKMAMPDKRPDGMLTPPALDKFKRALQLDRKLAQAGIWRPLQEPQKFEYSEFQFYVLAPPRPWFFLRSATSFSIELSLEEVSARRSAVKRRVRSATIVFASRPRHKTG